MFTRLARFRPFEPQHAAAGRRKVAHSNDNLPGRCRPAGELRSSPLACHWSINDSDGRLECHWEMADLEEGPSATRGVIFGLPTPAVAHRSLAQAAHKEMTLGNRVWSVESQSELSVSGIRVTDSLKSRSLRSHFRNRP